jgi:hypothetical protein
MPETESNMIQQFAQGRIIDALVSKRHANLAACSCGCDGLTPTQYLDTLEGEIGEVDDNGRHVAPAQHPAPLQAGFHFRTVCAWCQVVMEQGTPGAAISHGICAACDATLISTLERTRA